MSLIGNRGWVMVWLAMRTEWPEQEVTKKTLKCQIPFVRMGLTLQRPEWEQVCTTAI